MIIVATFWFLVAVSIVGLVWVLVSPSRLGLGLVFLFALTALALAGLWNWLLRDGLGPDSAPSHGLDAFRRFGSDMLFPAGVCGLIIATAIARFLLRHRMARELA